MRGVSVLAAVAATVHVGLADRSFGQASEVLDARNLGDRGVVFESTLIEGTRSGNLKYVVGLGDTNADGFDDIALTLASTRADPSHALIVRGRRSLTGRHVLPGPLPDTVVVRAAAIPADSALFMVNGPIGDVDGDGLADVFISVIDYSVRHDTGYEALDFLLYGSPDLEGDIDVDAIGTAFRGIVFRSTDPGVSFLSPCSIGDFDGDGKKDLAVGADRATNARGQVNAGILFILFAPEVLPPVVDLLEVGKSLPGIQIHGNPRAVEPEFVDLFGEFIGNLGGEIRSVGDFDGDGLGDLLVKEREVSPRLLYLIRGRRALPSLIELVDVASLENVTPFRGHPSGFHPGGFAGVGDLDGDGLGEIALGTPRYSYGPFVTGYSVVNLIRGGTELPAEVDRIPSPILDVSTTVFHSGDVDQFGMSVEPAGDMNADGIPDFVAAATWASPHGQDHAGEAHVLFGRPDFERDVRLADGYEGIRILGEKTNNLLGNVASPAGDFNGDGADDLLLLAPQLGPGDDKGRAYIIYGTGSGPVPLRLYRAEPAAGGLRGGTAVQLRGSGFKGVQGEVRVFFGGNAASAAGVISGSEIRVETPPGDRTGLVDVTLVIGADTRTVVGGFEYMPDYPPIDLADLGTRGLVLEGERMVEGDASPGSSISFGDLTGDGIDELAVGSQTPRGGTVTIVRGGPGLPPRLPAFTSSDRVSLITGLYMPADLPVHVAMLGDVDGDGVGDLGIGLPAGIAYILFGRPSFAPELLLEDELFERRAARLEAPGDPSEVRLARLGDATGDGIAEIALAFPRASPGLPEAGEVVIVAGRRVWPDDLYLDDPSSAHARIRGSTAGGRLGEEIAPAGDFNGDGAPDLIAATHGGAGSGRAYIIHGGAGLGGDLYVESLVLAAKGVQIDVADGFAHFSWLHVAPAGDTDGDGFDDVLLGVEDGGESNQGVTYLVRGRSLVPEPLTLFEEPAGPDGVTRFFGAAPRVQSGRVAPAGDFNADGLDDFLIAQLPEKPLAAYPWKVRLVLGSAGLPQAVDLSAAASLALEIPGPHAAQVFLPSRDAGDLNGDGQPDFAVTEGFLPFENGTGSVYVVFGAYGGTTFRRGDANFDDRIEISDAIFALAYLFLGGEAPRCADAVDADDDGELVLTDAVYTLNHLFGGGPEPPAPYPRLGEDPTTDDLGCRGF